MNELERKLRHREADNKWRNNPDHPERREANRARARAYYKANTEKVKAVVKKHRDQARDFLAEARKNPCEDCGKTYDPRIMVFHHVDPTTKSGEVSNRSSIVSMKKEMAKCVLVCPNCHALRHLELNR